MPSSTAAAEGASGTSSAAAPATATARDVRMKPMSGRRLRRVAEQRVDERVRLERREVVRALTETDELDRDTELALHGDDDAALGGTVQLRQHDAADVGDLGEDAGLHEAVLARRRVEHEEHLVDRPMAFDDALDLAELVH